MPYFRKKNAPDSSVFEVTEEHASQVIRPQKMFDEVFPEKPVVESKLAIAKKRGRPPHG